MNDPQWIPFKNFYEMLPSLLFLEPGGSMFEGKSQYIGHWMRTHNVEALVYPSARNDTFINLINNEMKDHRGWNLVDYIDSPPPAIDIMLDVSFFGTQTSLPEGVQIILPPVDASELQGSFVVKGLAAWHLKRLKQEGATGVLGQI